MATRNSGTQPTATAADTARFVLDAFSEQHDRIYALVITLRHRIEEAKDTSDEPLDPVAYSLWELLEEQVQDAKTMRLAERLLGLESGGQPNTHTGGPDVLHG